MIDLFANNMNAKTRRLHSNFDRKGSLGVDVFAHDWTGEDAWLCPTTYLIVQAICKMFVTRMRAVLIMPNWTTAEFWNEIFEKQFEKVREWKPFVKNNLTERKSIFNGYTKFNFLAVYYKN